MRAIAVVTVIGAFAIYIPVRVLAERGVLRNRHHVVGPARSKLPPFRIAFVADIQQVLASRTCTPTRTARVRSTQMSPRRSPTSCARRNGCAQD